MYESFYKLNPTPFRLTPDPHFFFESETHKRGLAYLRFAFYQREGFVVITGAPGTGKTELTLNLVEELPRNKVTLAKIVTTNLDADDLLDLVAASFQLDIENISKGSELKKLENYFIDQARIGKQVLLIIDEAHNLSVKSLLELSMLENFQLNEKPLMQCFLLGQLPLEEKLNLPELEPLKQRVIASARLESLDQQETRQYIIHRLSKSGWDNNPVIDDETFFFIHNFTKGVPRKINSLCNRLLLNSYVEGRHKIDADTVSMVTHEIQEEAVGESLDLDFADMQSTLDFSSDSQHDDGKQPVLPKEQKAQQAATSNNKMSHKNKKQGEQASPDNSHYIPEFLKKTQDDSSSDCPTVLGKNRESVVHESRDNGTVQVRNKPHQSSPQANATQSDTNVSVIQRATHQRVGRSSNLLDKELQFLASLAESNTLATAIQTIPGQKAKPEPAAKQKEITLPAVEEKTKRKKAPVRKVIIDESVYDNDELVEANDEKDLLEPKTSLPKMDDWRQTALAVIVVGSLIVSISWLYDGNPGPTNIVANNQSAIKSDNENMADSEVFSTAAPIEIELPVISSPNTNIDTNNEPVIETISESEIADAENLIASASATETSSVTDSSSYSGSSESSELDTQLTQLLEKASPESIKPANTADNESVATNENDAQIKLAAIPTDKRSTSPVPDKIKSDKTTKENQSSELSTKQNNTSPMSNSADSTSEVNDSTSIAIQKDISDSSAIAPQLKEPAEQLSSSVIASTEQPDTPDTSISMLNDSADTVTYRSEAAISNTDLTTLLSRLSAAYETGNLQQLVTTFAPDINSSDGSNRLQMLEEYQRLFNITDKRQLTIQDVKWSTKDRHLLGEGDFKVSIREKGATKYTTYQGKISFAVAKESDNVVIKKLDYDYGQ